MIFTGDSVLVDENTNALKDKLEWSWELLQESILKISRTKTELI